MLTVRGAFRLCLLGLLTLAACGLYGASYRPVADRFHVGDELFTNNTGVRHLEIEISKQGIDTLRRYSFRSRQEEQRTNVAATVREGKQVWTNVAVHIKGALGSFRPIDSKPSLTLNFDKWANGQSFHGLEKFSLNNSVQDPSYLNEKICREIYNAAGVPTPRADFATVELNGRYLGLFVLTEGWNKQFLARHFNNAKGEFFEPTLSRDINGAWPPDPQTGDTNYPVLKAATAAAQTRNHKERLARLRETVDLDRFISLNALDCLMWNWDGYAMNRNNYRMFHDTETDRLVFMPHGVDQMFWKPNGPIMAGRSGIVIKSLLETQEGRDAYLARFAEIRSNVFNLSAITNRIMEQSARIRPSLIKEGLAAVAQQESGAHLFRSRIAARARDVDLQLAGVKDLVRLKKDESVALTNWDARRQFGNIVLNRAHEPETLHIQIKSETSFGMWSSTVWLEEGRYVLEGRIKTRGVEGGLRNESGGAGFRVWSHRKETKGASWGWFPYSTTRDGQLGGIIPVFTNSVEQRLTGTTDWKTVTHEFELRNPLADLQIQCVLQGTAGEAWFDVASLRLRRVALNVSRSAKD
jgi:spore coat protein H